MALPMLRAEYLAGIPIVGVARLLAVVPTVDAPGNLVEAVLSTLICQEVEVATTAPTVPEPAGDAEAHLRGCNALRVVHEIETKLLACPGVVVTPGELNGSSS